MQTLPTLSDADIVPESYQMRLMAWRDEFTRGYFEIGDIANEIVMLNIQTGMKVEQVMIYSAIGRFCGKSGRTVRDYAEISAFFPETTREQYDMLPFSHFRFAKSCGLKWEEVLEYSMLHPDASEEKLAHEFLSVAASPVAVNDNSISNIQNPEYSNNMSVAATGVASNGVAATSVAAGLSGIYVLANLISQAETILNWEMQNETRRKLKLSLDGLKDVLKELSYVDEKLAFVE